MVLEIINSCVTNTLHHNPNLVYTLLHRRELFAQFRTHPTFHDIIQNIDTVSSPTQRHSRVLHRRPRWAGNLCGNTAQQVATWNNHLHIIIIILSFFKIYFLLFTAIFITSCNSRNVRLIKKMVWTKELHGIWSPGRKEGWKGPLVVTDASTSLAEDIFRWLALRHTEDDFRPACWNVSHCQQSLPGLLHPNDQIPSREDLWIVTFSLY